MVGQQQCPLQRGVLYSECPLLGGSTVLFTILLVRECLGSAQCIGMTKKMTDISAYTAKLHAQMFQ